MRMHTAVGVEFEAETVPLGNTDGDGLLYQFAHDLSETGDEADELIENFLVCGGGSVIYGDSNSGKTFLAIDVGGSVARVPCRSVCGACGRSMYFDIVGTSVRESMNEQATANITASAIGTNRKRATPCRKNIGTKTMQMQRVETKAGMAISCAPSRMASSSALPRIELMVSICARAAISRDRPTWPWK
jgi:uncharacterized protein YuzB (UPF0349 family)